MILDIEKVIESTDPLEGGHSFCAEELLVPNLNKCDMMRVNLFDNHLPQAVVLDDPDFPNVFTNFENQIGKYSTSYKKSDREWEVVGKIKKNDLCYTYILQDEDNNIEIVHTHPAERITERYGYKYVNPIDKKSEGDIIKKNEPIVHSTTYDKHLNFRYGRNLKACYLSFNNMTYEDAIVISESAAKKLACYNVDEIVITLNTNDILLNLYGDNDTYKCLPDIGESLGNVTILAGRRRINYESMLYDLSTANIKKVNYDTDTIFYVGKNSIIYDIEVFCNSDIDDLKNYPYYSQILDILDDNVRYYTELKDILDSVVDDPDFYCSDDVKFYYKRACDITAENRVFKYDGNTFDRIVIKIKTYNLNPLVIGSKVSGRFGNKGVVSCIVPDNEMPINEYGEHVDICLNPTGVIGRENIAQLYEHELNFIADCVVRQSKDSKIIEEFTPKNSSKKEFTPIDKRFYYIMEFYKIIQTELNNQYTFFTNQWKTFDDKQKIRFMKEIDEKGLFIHQPPFFGNVTIEMMVDLYQKFKCKPYKLTVNGKDVETPMIMGNLYFIRLKHDPKGKVSARSSGDININNIPSKSSSYKYHTALFSKTPVRLGEMEFTSLLLTQNIEDVTRYLAQTSNNPEERQNFNEALLTEDVFNIEKIERIGSKSITSQILKTEFQAIGIENVMNEDATQLEEDERSIEELFAEVLEDVEVEEDDEE
jgi:DNA-directed RNA polymerase beta subunit